MADNESFDDDSEWPEDSWNPNHAYQGTDDPHRTAHGPAGPFVRSQPTMTEAELLASQNPASYDPSNESQVDSLRATFQALSGLEPPLLEPRFRALQNQLPRDRSISFEQADEEIGFFARQVRNFRSTGRGYPDMEQFMEEHRAHREPENSSAMYYHSDVQWDPYLGDRPPETERPAAPRLTTGATPSVFNGIPEDTLNDLIKYQNSRGIPDDKATTVVQDGFKYALGQTGDADGLTRYVKYYVAESTASWIAQQQNSQQQADTNQSQGPGKRVYGRDFYDPHDR